MIESKVKRGRKETADMSLRAFIDFCFSPVSSWKASTISYFLKKKILKRRKNVDFIFK